jgi:hypothetical protein
MVAMMRSTHRWGMISICLFIISAIAMTRLADAFLSSSSSSGNNRSGRIPCTTNTRQQQKQSWWSTSWKAHNTKNNIGQGEDYYPVWNDESIKIGGKRSIREHVGLLDSSLKKLTGKGVYERMGLSIMNDDADDDEAIATICKEVCWNRRYVLISHGTESNPIYNFGNKAALEAFVRTWDSLLELPSAQSVVLRSQDEVLRNKLMQQVTEQGFVEGASGIRVRGDRKFIQLVNAVVWNCHDDNTGDYIGQAALFDRERCPIWDSPEDAM